MTMNDVNITSRKSDADIIEALKARVPSNRCLQEICYVFSIRERSRGNLSMAALKVMMNDEGFSGHSTADYEVAFRLMAESGLGKIKYDRSGKIHALAGIDLKFREVGLAVLGKIESVAAFKRTQNKFRNAPIIVGMKDVKEPVNREVVIEAKPRQSTQRITTPLALPRTEARVISHADKHPVNITLMINGQPLSVDLPPLTFAEFGVMVSKIGENPE